MKRSSERTPLKSPSPIELREIALAAMVDVRTLQRALRGDRVQHLSLERIRRILAARGQEQLLERLDKVGT
jgi:hypothetical protein